MTEQKQRQKNKTPKQKKKLFFVDLTAVVKLNRLILYCLLPPKQRHTMSLVINARKGLRTRMPYAPRLKTNEVCILTKSTRGAPSEQEMAGARFVILFENGTFAGFYNPSIQTLYRNPSFFCKDTMRRRGETNQWRGPRHVLVLRGARWVPIDSL
jgi:hypothetical protein